MRREMIEYNNTNLHLFTKLYILNSIRSNGCLLNRFFNQFYNLINLKSTEQKIRNFVTFYNYSNKSVFTQTIFPQIIKN